MSDQLHKRFSGNQLKSLLESYIKKETEISYILSIPVLEGAGSLSF